MIAIGFVKKANGYFLIIFLKPYSIMAVNYVNPFLKFVYRVLHSLNKY